eukprot:scaffold104962_cov28-Tisochrysis_lutea.AAC.1
MAMDNGRRKNLGGKGHGGKMEMADGRWPQPFRPAKLTTQVEGKKEPQVALSLQATSTARGPKAFAPCWSILVENVSVGVGALEYS